MGMQIIFSATPRRWTYVGLGVVCWIIVGGIFRAWAQEGSIVNCDIQTGACIQKVEGRAITLDIWPRPVKAMQDLTFRVTIEPQPILSSPPSIRLNMPAMDMGPNLVRMERTAPGTYEGKGVIVRCRSGIRTWIATVQAPGLQPVDFIFDVIY